MVLRDYRGELIFTACRQLLTCDNSLQAELEACREGLQLALYRTNLPILVELDCFEAVSMLSAKSANRSQVRALVEDISRMITAESREILFSHINRSQNNVSHALAAYGRSTPRTAVWLRSGLDCIVNISEAQKPL